MAPAHGAFSVRSRLGLIGCFTFLLGFCALPVLRPMLAFAVPALENESVVVGEILARTLVDASALGIQPAQKLWRFNLRVVSVEAVAGADNVLRGQAGNRSFQQ